MKQIIAAVFFLIASITNCYALHIVKIEKDICTIDEVNELYDELAGYYADDLTEIEEVLYLDVVFCRNLSVNMAKEQDSNADNIYIKNSPADLEESFTLRLSNSHAYLGGWNPTLPDDRCSGIGENGGTQVKGYFLNLYAQVYRQGVRSINLYAIPPETFIK